MRLEMLETSETRRVLPIDLANYSDFSLNHPPSLGVNELQLFERFYAGRLLMGQGMDIFADSMLFDPEDNSATRVDMCGTREDEITAVFCEIGDPRPSLVGALGKVRRSQNTTALILVPSGADWRALQETLHGTPDNGKVSVETLGWFDNELDEALQHALEMIGMLGNQTRMRMLTPLFRKKGAKRDYRERINPKLVYRNLSMLVEAGFVSEKNKGTYELSRLGKSVLAEFITFLEKARKTLDVELGRKEVRNV